MIGFDHRECIAPVIKTELKHKIMSSFESATRHTKHYITQYYINTIMLIDRFPFGVFYYAGEKKSRISHLRIIEKP